MDAARRASWTCTPEIPYCTTILLPVNGVAVGQEGHAGLDRTYLALSVFDGEPETVTSNGSCHHVPELSDVLERVVKGCAAHGQPDESRSHQLVLRVGSSCSAQQNIRVDQTRDDRHLVVVLVNPLPRDGGRQRRDLVGKLGK